VRYGDLRRSGYEFARLGAHDRAWRVCNRTVEAAVRDGQSPMRPTGQAEDCPHLYLNKRSFRFAEA
jgi:hypothetical protein